ncbi:hypothetical protein PFBG_06055, partial [Plasmodium falciparum 7G8]
DAKHVLDEFGQQVYEQVKNGADGTAKNYIGELKGDLNKATNIIPELIGNIETCNLVQEYYKQTNGGGGKGKRYPCTELGEKVEVNRFSDTLGGQCTDSKMRSGGKGACAPYRRLHLCHHNLESISDYDSNAKHNLLVDVCMAAKYEGNSIKTPYPIHQQKYKDTGTASQLCTVLARSFADIGDIVRGRDLFLGNTYESAQRDQLDKKLKEVFGKIHGGLSEEAKGHYKDPDKNYYQLREDWWTANRHTVWEAITCEAKTDDKYFRKTCCSGEWTDDKCRCKDKKTGKNDTDQVPTYFDYVPQYLRWFEEWAEDFCRLRKRKLKDAKSKCRGENNDKYCDLNRHDCEKTASGKHVFVEEDNCIGCHFSCSHFVKWIDNQKLEFEKQVKKYKSEMQKYKNGGGGSGSGRKKRAAGKSNYDGYESKFYKKMKEKNNYETVENFLDLLNKEDVCTKKLNDQDEEEGKIDFKTVKSSSAADGGDGNNKTFDHTTYCQACPWCGAEKDNTGKWTPKDETCGKGKDYTNYEDTQIPILTGDKTKSDMVRKYKKFCNGNGGKGVTSGATGEKGKNGDNITETWKCYYYKENENNVGKKDINFCVLQDDKVGTSKEKSMHYNSFFWKWVYHMLHDSLDWRNELGSCINNNTNDNTCRNNKKCKNPCECFEKWVDQKKETEWEKIKDHFKKQKDIVEQTGCDPGVTLAAVLDKDLLLKSIEDTHVDAKDIERIGKMLKETGVLGGVAAGGPGVAGFLPLLGGDLGTTGCGVKGANGQNSIIDKLLQHELNDATKCKNCQPTKVKNPCYGDKQYPALAEKVAKEMQGDAHTKMLDRSGKNGETKSSLEGDIKKAEFKNGGEGKNLNGDICKIDTTYSNDSRSNTTDGACTGKDGSNGGVRMKIGTIWQTGEGIKISDPHLYLPPRREHMCTSNLEKLSVGSSGLKGDKAIHSLLGHVLLSANYEAHNIKTKYKQNEGKKELNDQNDKKTVCRAMKYSFADLGDIIKGTDLWDANENEKRTQGHLNEIFHNIYNNNSDIKEKYKNIDDDKHTKLRKDWWEANRETVWEAMKCKTPHGNFPCSGTDVPLEDYIPQRLRWMVEWAEWFCKDQSRLYEELLQKCGKCKDKKGGKGCMQNTQECNDCKQACDKYKTKINTWKQQWKQMELEYTPLYWQAENGSYGMAFPGADYQQMLDFFKELQKTIRSSSSKRPKRSTPTDPIFTSPYFTAEGYIQQEARTGQCLVQNEFCEYKNGLTSRSSDAKENKNYAFKNPPHGYDLACTCNTSNTGSRARSEEPPGTPPPSVPTDDDNYASSEDEDEEEEEEDHDGTHSDQEEAASDETEGAVEKTVNGDGQGEDKTQDEGEGTTTKDEVTPPEKKDKVNPCQIVDKLFKNPEDFTDACTLKYVTGKNYGWKCISGDKTATISEGSGGSERSGRKRREADSGKPTSDKGSICVPPRRRKLYLGGFDKFISGQTTPATSSQSPNGDPLLAAFVESAAVETFFAWHKYKEEKKPQGGGLPGVGVAPGVGVGNGGDGEEEEQPPQNQLASGTIPTDFLRQMFYTLGDYRDICVGNTPSGIDTVSASGDNPTNKVTMKQISSKIEEILKNGDNNKPSGVQNSVNDPLQNGDTSPQNSDKRTNWWNNNAKHIWKGMVCALTYEENGSGGEGKTIEQVKTAKGDDLFQQLKTQYGDYENVKLENSETKAKSNDDPINNPKLKDFVEIPTYFRYLHEWGQNFCKERKKRLAQIKEDCMDDNKQKYSGDGEECEKILVEEANTFKDLEYRTCAKPCRWYRKWIEKKKTEYDKQEKIYGQQKTDAKSDNGNKYDSNFVGKLDKDYASIESFLGKLKNGPCKNNNGNEKKGQDKKFFEDTEKTFGHEKYCGTCSKFRIKCDNDKCTSGDTNVTCNGKTDISANDIGNGGNSIGNIDMVVSDKDANGFNGLEACKTSGIFKGIRKDEWKCRNVCGYVVCKPKTSDGKENKEQIIIITALLKRWVEYFLEDYKKIKHKISHCKENDEKNICKKDCQNKCKCVKAWITKKSAEWENIKTRFIEQYKIENDEYYYVRSFLETFLVQIGAANANNDGKKLIKLSKFGNSCGCSASAHKQKDSKQDAIDCMLKKLEDKIGECEKKHGEKSVQTCSPSETPENNLPLPDDEEDLLLEETENQVKAPNICPPTPAETVDEGGCKPAPTRPKKPAPLLPRPKTHLTEYWSDSWRTSTTPRILGKWKGRKIITTCEIVGEIINKSKGGTKSIDGCHPKNYDKKYAGWECDKSSNLVKENGICMSPRRQKLCVHYLKQSMTNSDGLKKAFVKCAAAETFLLWQYYKSKNGNANNLDNTLKGGNIPEEFKRQMFYTFADYRDLCLDTDLSSKTDMRSAVSIAKYNIYEVLNKSYQTSIDQRKIWWEKNGPSIWEGMLCALEKTLDDKKKLNYKYKYESVTFGDSSGPNLQTFSSRPQFLRWFTEWGEDFCKEQKKELDILLKACKYCTVSEGGISEGTKTCNDKENCDACKQACDVYKNFIQTWKRHYEKQKTRYNEVKGTSPYNNDNDVTESTEAYEYLDTQLKNMMCTNESTYKNCDYTCMKNVSTQKNSEKIPQSLDDTPNEYKDRCNCVRDECSGLSVTDSGFPDVSAFAGGIPSGRCKAFESPPKKNEPPQYDPTNDILKSTIPVIIVLALGSIAFLFINEHIYKKKHREILEY